MKVEIWSDVMCPFCYIGKRRFEDALQQFTGKDQVEIQWRSFQLAPDMVTDTTTNVYDYLADKKGWTVDYSKKVHQQLEATAKEAGLDYNFDTAIPANSFRAHRFSHLAASYNLQDQAEERLFSAYFTEGKNIDDPGTLMQMGSELGLPAGAVTKMLESDAFSTEVKQDIVAAEQVGVRGVPFFVFDNKYAVSGAQPSSVFLEALQKSFAEKTTPAVSDSSATCSADGDNC